MNLNAIEKILDNLDDNTKINLFSLFKITGIRKMILNSFSSDKERIECCKYLEDVDLISELIMPSLKEKKSYFDVIKNLNNSQKKLILINTYFDDEMKYECISSLRNDEFKMSIAFNIKDEILRVKSLKYIESDYNRYQPILSLKTDEALEKYIELYPDSYLIYLAIEKLSNDELKMKYYPSLTDDFNKKNILISLKSDDIKIKYIPTLSLENHKTSVLNSLSTNKKKIENVNLFGDKVCDIINYVSNTDMHNIKNLSNEEYLIDIYSKYYYINPNYLREFINVFGYSVFQKISNENIKIILKESFGDENFNKFIKLFSKNNIRLDMKVVNNICFKACQKKFDIEKNDIRNTFHQMLEYLSNNDKINFDIILNNVINSLTKEELDNILVGSNININELSYNIFNNENNSIYLNILHLITNKYIDNERNEYLLNNIDQMHKQLNLDFKLNKKYVINHIIGKDSTNQIIQDLNSYKEELTKEERVLLKDEDLLRKCIEFKKDPSLFNAEDKKIIGKVLRVFDELVYKKYGFINTKISKNSFLYYDPNAKFDEKIKDVDKDKILEIIENLNMNLFFNDVLLNDDVYNDLLNTLNEYKILGYGDTFSKIFSSLDIPYDSKMCSNIISYYAQINKLYFKEKKDIFELLYKSQLYGSSDLKQKVLFTEEDFELLVKDPKLNSSKLCKEVRLSKAVKYIKDMYNDEYITIPSFDKVIEVNGKNINVVVGNKTNTVNLTTGERTGSCMRIGGAANSLFDFIITNPNAFNIIFRDPIDNEFISRVAGFRNGNSIFLNQLRNSSLPYYSNKDLAKACKMAVMEIINESNMMGDKIDYVFISDTYAMTRERLPHINLKKTDITQGYGHVYNDIKLGSLLLYNSSRVSKIKPEVEFYKPKIKYPIVRDKVHEYFYDKAIEEAQRIEMIDELLLGKEFKNIMLRKKNIVYLIGGEDWYIALDDSNNVISHVLESRKNNVFTLKEFNYYKNEIFQKKESILSK